LPADHDSYADCKQTCAAAEWIESKTKPATGDDTSKCASVGPGYWSDTFDVAQRTISQTTATEGGLLARTQCPANYAAGPAASQKSDCTASCAAGQYVAAAGAADNAAGCVAITNNPWWSAAHSVKFGQTSAGLPAPAPDSGDVRACIPNYGIDAAHWGVADANYADSIENHDNYDDCKQTCAAAEWIESKTKPATGADTSRCASAGTGYWSDTFDVAKRTVSQTTATEGDLIGRTQCPAKYADGPAASQKSDCTASCTAGQYVAAAGAADNAAGCATPIGTDWWSEAHDVKFGLKSIPAIVPLDATSSPVHYCITPYATKNTAIAGDHDNFDDCTRTCPAGQYTATPTSACDDAGAGYYAPGETVPQSSADAGTIIKRFSCPGGKYCPGPDDAAPTNCSPGKFCPGPACSDNTCPGSSSEKSCSFDSYCLANSSDEAKCPTNYRGRKSGEATAKNECIAACGPGQIVAAAAQTDAAAGCTTPEQMGGKWWYTPLSGGNGRTHDVFFGNASAENTDYKYCLANFATPDTQTAADHDSHADCTHTCPAGRYAATATGQPVLNTAGCVPVGKGWWSTTKTATQNGENSSAPPLDRTQCRPGQFCSGEENTGYVECPSRSTSDAGAEDIASCYIATTGEYLDGNNKQQPAPLFRDTNSGEGRTLEELLNSVDAGTGKPGTTGSADRCYYNP
jgi:hypothetical protein